MSNSTENRFSSEVPEDYDPSSNSSSLSYNETVVSSLFFPQTNTSSNYFVPCNDSLIEKLVKGNLQLSYLSSLDTNLSKINCSWLCSFNATICENFSSDESMATAGSDDSLQFSLLLSIFIGTAIGLCSLLTIAGNILVILAFVFERAIRQPSNYFIASLAVSDMMIGCISMPFFGAYTIVGKWTLGNLACDLWLAADYTVCLVSIYTVLLITIDRYCSVRIAARYRSWRTKNKVLIMVSVTWVVPVLVFFVSIMGWDSFQGYRDLKPHECEVQFLKNKIFNTALIFGYFYSSLTVMLILYASIYKTARDMHKKTVAKQKKIQMMVAMNRANDKPSIAISKTQSTLLSQDKPNQMTSTSNSLMHNSKQADQQNNKSSSKTNYDKRDGSDQDRSSSPIFDSDDETVRMEHHKSQNKTKHQVNKSSKIKHQNSEKRIQESKASSKSVHKADGSKKMKRKSSTTPVIENPASSLLDTENIMSPVEPKESLCMVQERSPIPPSTLDIKPCVSLENKNPLLQQIEHELATSSIMESATMTFIDQETNPNSNVAAASTTFQPEKCIVSPNIQTLDSTNLNTVELQDSDPITTNNKSLANSDKVDTEVKLSATRQKPDTKVVKSSSLRTKINENNKLDPIQAKKELVASLSKRSNKRKRKGDAEKRQTSKSENRARKALRTISFIMGAFVLCWTPYHILALIEGFCTIGRCTNYHVFYFTYFLCYANSPLNPFCYALANQQFKKTFARILRGNFNRT